MYQPIVKSFSDYRDFEGVDASLEISLYEYGLIWHLENAETQEYKFIHAIHCSGEYDLFDYALMDKKEWLRFFEDEKSWFKAGDIATTSGMSIEELKDNFPKAVHEALLYYGFENIFGSSYNGFEIKR